MEGGMRASVTGCGDDTEALLWSSGLMAADRASSFPRSAWLSMCLLDENLGVGGLGVVTEGRGKEATGGRLLLNQDSDQ